MEQKFALSHANLDIAFNATAPNGELSWMTAEDAKLLHWHIKNAAQAVSGTSQHATYNGFLDFIASHYAMLNAQPNSEELGHRAFNAMCGRMSALRSATNATELHAAYAALVAALTTFLGTDPVAEVRMTEAQTRRRQLIAEALWVERRTEEDREDEDLEDLPQNHPVWAAADAVLAALTPEFKDEA